jgi:voltage-gated potassium channel Kch
MVSHLYRAVNTVKIAIFHTHCFVNQVVFAFETMPQLKNFPPMTWLILEIFFTSVFSLEYLMRFFTATAFGGSLGNFFTRIMNVCDFLALLPFFIELATRSSNGHTVRILRAIRMFRLFRVLKLGRYSIGMRIMAETIRRSSSALWVLAFFVCIAVVLFSSVVWYMERFNCPAWEQFNIAQQMEYEGLCTYTSDGYAIDMGLCCTEDNTPSNFPSIIHAFWWAIVTLSTVGYGDVVPWTVAGRIFGIFTMFSGILVIALPVAIIGSKFQEVYQEVEVAQMEKNRMVIFQQKQHGEEEIEREAIASLSPSWGPSVDASPGHDVRFYSLY